jgi:hypothetical protein
VVTFPLHLRAVSVSLAQLVNIVPIILTIPFKDTLR